ncbi:MULTISPECIES: hypothetical protein [unclassified Streptomyces]|uniref:hypothetical protein n=1 Tax=unclassified Streptomyces TaxID=2593676 RepID=UPI0003AB14DE|nr:MULTISPECIES: hypothetical protein [unclassified Streptomyces]
MEPRELWERHAVLAQAFCISDDEVRRTQGLLDEAEARRSRTLAAFAVTVGSDEVVADLLGLDAREVRLARRTVGKDDARAVAKNLLEESERERRAARRAEPQPEKAEPPRPASPAVAAAAAAAAAAIGNGWPRATTVGSVTSDSLGWIPPRPAAPAPTPPPAPAAAPAPPPAQAPGPPPMPVTEPAWSPALDAVLVHSYHTGADLTALATELGLDVHILAARAHQLSSESQTVRPMNSDRIGRHRRMTDVQPPGTHDTGHIPRTDAAAPPPPPYDPQAAWAASAHAAQWAAPQDPYASWQPHEPHASWPSQESHNPWASPPPPAPPWDPSAVTVAQHDWDGILSQWEAATAPHISSPGQQYP